MKLLVVVTLLALSLTSSPGVAQDFDKGLAAALAGDFATALAEFAPLAEQGDRDAQYNLAMMYYMGQGVPKSDAKAAKWLGLSAAKGKPEAQFRLGTLYDAGRGVRKNAATAAKWYSKAAAQGFASAQYFLGLSYEAGDGVPRNDAMAAQWYSKAAKQGIVEAQTNLGTLYAEGRGVRQNYDAANKLFREAARQNDAVAQSNLGLAYFQGLGVPQDNVSAYMWADIAAGNGFKDAVAERKQAAARMTPEEIAEARRRARACKSSGYRKCD